MGEHIASSVLMPSDRIAIVDEDWVIFLGQKQTVATYNSTCTLLLQLKRVFSQKSG